MLWTTLFKKIGQNVAVFLIVFAFSGAFFFNQFMSMNKVYFEIYRTFDSREQYSYSQTFGFKFKEGFKPELAYDRYNNNSILQDLSLLSNKLQLSKEICSKVYEGISEFDLKALNEGSETPKYFSNERGCIPPYLLKTREFTITAQTTIPVGFELAEKIQSVLKSEIESEVSKMDGNPEIYDVYNVETIVKNSRATIHPQGFSQAVQFIAISLVISFCLTLIFSSIREYISKLSKTSSQKK